MNKIIEYIESLQDQPFDGWNDDEIRGYTTACISIKNRLLQDFGKVGGLKDILYTSGRMSTAAQRVVTSNAYTISSYIDALKAAVDEYDRLMIEYSLNQSNDENKDEK
jgi:DNA-dependent RNA polymerase auxiliary subunit epsilon